MRIFTNKKWKIGGKHYKDTGRVCRKCKARVWKSNNPEYKYQCFECDEDLYKFETEKVDECTLLVEGFKKDIGFVNNYLGDVWCADCGHNVYNIPSDRISLCPHCQAELIPCACCFCDCTWDKTTMSCHRFAHTNAYKSRHGG